jgi:hypothetical protein
MLGDDQRESGRARRELSVIEERDASDFVSREDGEARPQGARAPAKEGTKRVDEEVEDRAQPHESDELDDRPTVDHPDSPGPAGGDLPGTDGREADTEDASTHERSSSARGSTVEDDEAHRVSVTA